MPKQTENRTQTLVLPGVEKSLVAKAGQVAKRLGRDRNVWLVELIQKGVDDAAKPQPRQTAA